MKINNFEELVGYSLFTPLFKYSIHELHLYSMLTAFHENVHIHFFFIHCSNNEMIMINIMR